jgi:hypothetical protein
MPANHFFRPKPGGRRSGPKPVSGVLFRVCRPRSPEKLPQFSIEGLALPSKKTTPAGQIMLIFKNHPGWIKIFTPKKPNF